MGKRTHWGCMRELVGPQMLGEISPPGLPGPSAQPSVLSPVQCCRPSAATEAQLP